MPRAVRILDVDVDAVTMAEAVEMIGEAVDAHRGHGGPTYQVATVNPEFVMRARHDSRFRQVLRTASLRTADGVGLVLASRILGHDLPERITGVELLRELARAAIARGDRLFLLGGGEGVAEAAAAALTDEFSELKVAGTFAGDASEAGDAETLAAVHAAAPDVILVAYGAPAQELWLARNLEACGASVGVGVGGSFDYLAGKVPRAPGVIRRLGLEWLFRLVRQPWRAPRMAVLPVFLVLVLRQRLLSR